MYTQCIEMYKTALIHRGPAPNTLAVPSAAQLRYRQLPWPTSRRRWSRSSPQCRARGMVLCANQRWMIIMSGAWWCWWWWWWGGGGGWGWWRRRWRRQRLLLVLLLLLLLIQMIVTVSILSLSLCYYHHCKTRESTWLRPNRQLNYSKWYTFAVVP